MLIPDWQFWMIFLIMAAIIGVVAALYWLEVIKSKKDLVIMVDKNNRWLSAFTDTAGKAFVTIARKKYPLTDETSLLNKQGKALHIFSEDNPRPLKISHKAADWLSSDALINLVNNETVKKVVKPTEPLKDLILLLGAIGGMIAGVSATIALLIQTGVITL